MSHPRSTILVVDDTRENLQILGEMLENQGHEVRIATDGAQALENVRLSPPDLILLDIMMPGMDGLEVCRKLKADPVTADIPVIFLSALDGEADEAQGLDLGAVDYIAKPFKIELVRKRIENQLKIRQLQADNLAHREHLEAEVADRTRQLTETNQRLQALDATKGLFLRFLEQEIRTPASGLVGIGQLALANIEDEEKRHRFQEMFNSIRTRLETILLNYNRLVSYQEGLAARHSHTHPVRLDDVMAQAFQKFGAEATAKGLRLPPSPGESSIVAGDRDLMETALSVIAGFLVEVAGPGTTIGAVFGEKDGVTELRLSVPAPQRPEFGPISLVDGIRLTEYADSSLTPTQNLSLAGIILDALAGSGTLDPASSGNLAFTVRLKTYRPT